ncbi:MAG: Ig-like domain-containing protein [Mogibacterium sp.]|nr:Ig-like domain-containing protein [Mogibacterium sp.]
MKKGIILTITVSLLILLAGTFPMPVYSSSAESMDINDFDSTMSVGSTQTISVVLYPDDADDTVRYSSSNTSVATISQGGKISAKSAGTTNITISAGSITQTLQLSVEPVTIEVSDFESKMDVGDTQTISVTLYPSSASDKVTYSSLNPSVATISQGGKIEAKSAGKTDITVSAGGASKTMTLTVSVGSKGISLNSTFITLKPGEKYKLKGKVSPSSAEQKLTFKSSDTSVAKVSSKGVIKAIGLGSTSIIVSNGDLTASADVIVNNSSSGSGTMYFGADEPTDGGTDESSSLQGGSLNTEKLKMFQKTGNTLTIEKDDYIITLEGSDIVNAENGMSEDLHIVRSDEGYTFSLGGGDDFLPGKISVEFKDSEMRKCKYVYLEDKSNDQDQLYSELDNGSFETDVAGSYRITYEKLETPGPDMKIILITGAVIIAIGCIYLILRKTMFIF